MAAPSAAPKYQDGASSATDAELEPGTQLPPGADLMEDAEVREARFKRHRWAMVHVVVTTTLYYGFGMAYYTQRGRKVVGPSCECSADPFSNETLCLADWDVVDTIYFATVTMTTTGYGDLKPLTTETRLVTLLYLLFGLIVAFPSIATAMAPMYSRLELVLYNISSALMRQCIGARSDGTLVDIDGDGFADYETPPNAVFYYMKGVSAWLFIWLSMQIAFAAGYVGLEPDIFDFESAFYLCIVTATTVGYGDIAVSDTHGPKLFATVHILFSVSSLAALLNTAQMLYSERKLQLRKANLLERQLDVGLIQSLDKDNNGLDKLEFVVGMLTKLEIVQWDDVEPFLAKFDELDKDKSGRLDKRDLVRMVEDTRRKAESIRSKSVGPQPWGAPAAASSESGDVEPYPGYDVDECTPLPATAETPGKSRTLPPIDVENGMKADDGVGVSSDTRARNVEVVQMGPNASARKRVIVGSPGRLGGLPFYLFSGGNGNRRRPNHTPTIKKKRVQPKM